MIGRFLSTTPRRALALFAAATVLASLELLQGGLMASYAYGRPVPVRRLLEAVIPFWYILALLVPGLVAVAKRVPINGTPWPRFVAIHLVTATAFVLTHLTAGGYVSDILLPESPWLPAGMTFTRNLARLLFTFGFSELFTYTAIVGGYYAWEYSRRYVERERQAAQLLVQASDLRADAVRATLRALRMQLHPHFLFNALNAVAGLIRRREGTRALEVLAELGDLLRITLSGDLPHEIPLDQELEFLRHYLKIETIRFEDRLTVTYDIGPGAAGCLVPVMVLQPLVENAIRHGTGKCDGAGEITVRAHRRNGVLQVSVLDTGAGPPHSGPPRFGIGLSNTAERLERMYGARGELSLRRGPHGGAQVTITIPAREESSGSTLPALADASGERTP